MDRTNNFIDAVERVKKLKQQPSDQDLLQLYGLYKQVTVGNNNNPRPMFWDLKGQSKWDAWESYRNMSKEKAMDHYIHLVKRLEK
jgi:diazepam-binding inhibitor (GABA receptor modulating acyl-CoA-binding protein)